MTKIEFADYKNRAYLSAIEAAKYLRGSNMKNSPKCSFCEKVIKKKEELFILKEDVEDWDSNIHRIKVIKADKAACVECLIDYIEDTERVPRTSSQIEYRYIGIEDC